VQISLMLLSDHQLAGLSCLWLSALQEFLEAGVFDHRFKPVRSLETSGCIYSTALGNLRLKDLI